MTLVQNVPYDLATVEDLREQIECAAATDGGLVVSLTETEFIDSSVTHAIFDGDKGLRANGRRLVLHVATASIVERVLEISGLRTALPTTGSLDQAIALATLMHE